MQRSDAGIFLLDADPDLAAGLSDEDFAAARRYLRTRVRTLDPGPWDPPTAEGREEHLGLLVVDGVLVRDVSVRRRCCAELIGAGDILRPWDRAEALTGSVDHALRWQVLQRTLVAELDGRVTGALARWPAIVSAIVARSIQRTRAVALQHALTQVPGVDVRLHLVLWHLADRWGRVTPKGVVLRLPLTHQLLGRLIGARRPSVTSALQRLHRDGLAVRADDGSWLLRGAPQDVRLEHVSTRRRRVLSAVA
jgi:hypothetical protein